MVQPPTDSRFRLGDEKRAPLWVWLLAFVLHVPVAVLVVSAAWRHAVVDWVFARPAPVELTPPEQIAFVLPRRSVTGPRTQPPRGLPQRALPIVNVAPQVHALPAENATPPRGLPIPDLPTPPGATDPVVVPAGGAPASGQMTRIAPAYGSGILWGRGGAGPTAEQLAERVLGLSTGAKMDSVVASRVQQYVDSMAAEYASQRPPSWTTTIGAKKYGLDSKFIYLGPIKIPTAILALLPINIQANPTEAEYNKRLNSMRADLYEAARRSQNYADFKTSVRQLRAEKEAEREFKENQRTAPKSGGNQP